jgi:energy-coupling factor transporter ATP-binding protein EcfA2
VAEVDRIGGLTRDLDGFSFILLADLAVETLRLEQTQLRGETAALNGLNNINLIMGRNGSGKSRFLRDIEEVASRSKDKFYVRYVSPERAGTFKRDGNVLTNMGNNPDWLRGNRARNQVENFKGASATLFRESETIYLRRLAKTPTIRMDESRNFEADRLSKVNQLLTNISLEMGDTDFEFRSLSDGSVIVPEQISSGESEAVALASEIHIFSILSIPRSSTYSCLTSRMSSSPRPPISPW